VKSVGEKEQKDSEEKYSDSVNMVAKACVRKPTGECLECNKPNLGQ
jgi:hypothetical protein